MEQPEQKQISINPEAILHFSSAFGGFMPFGGIILPYIIAHFAREQWQEQKAELSRVKREILIFQLPLSILALLMMLWIPTFVASLPLEALSNMLTLTLLPLMAAALGCVQFGVPLYAGIRVLAGYSFRYPTLITIKK